MTASAEPEARAAGLRIPDFYIVGHPKSGTTALYEMLRRHPQIFMPDLKEPRWFASDLRERFQQHGAEGHPGSLEEYATLFEAAEPGQLVGEASPSYLRSHAAAGEIARLRPDARIIAVLREPADFLRSMHLEMVQNRVEEETDLRLALEREALRAPGGESVRRYTDRVAYVEQLRRYWKRFAPEQVLVLIYDDFRADNDATVRRVLRFLGVDDTVAIARVEANPSVRVRSLALDDAVRSAYAGRGPAGRMLKAGAALVPGSVRSRLFGAVRRRLVYAPPEQPDPALMDELRRRFKPEVVALSEQLDRDLVSLWGYERLG